MSIVINVRGACGAGKSTLVKNLLNELEFHDRPPCEWVHAPRRRKPVGYLFPEKDLFVPGHYEIQNGGLDTIGDLNSAYRLIHKYVVLNRNVLFEGMNNRADEPHLSKLRDYASLSVVFLDRTAEECEEGFRTKGQKRNIEYVQATWRKAQREIAEFQHLSYDVHVLGRDEAAAFVREKLGI